MIQQLVNSQLKMAVKNCATWHLSYTVYEALTNDYDGWVTTPITSRGPTYDHRLSSAHVILKHPARFARRASEATALWAVGVTTLGPAFPESACTKHFHALSARRGPGRTCPTWLSLTRQR